MQVARRVQDERRIKDGKSKSGEDLDEEQGRRSFGDVSEPAFPVRHVAILSGLLVVVYSPFMSYWVPDALLAKMLVLSYDDFSLPQAVVGSTEGP